MRTWGLAHDSRTILSRLHSRESSSKHTHNTHTFHVLSMGTCIAYKSTVKDLAGFRLNCQQW